MRKFIICLLLLFSGCSCDSALEIEKGCNDIAKDDFLYHDIDGSPYLENKSIDKYIEVKFQLLCNGYPGMIKTYTLRPMERRKFNKIDGCIGFISESLCVTYK
ncbi:hypothetical protein [Algoriphagus confluentis]|uniref:Lipoprotein n=1 Tax=Algoriphagus confluentis TaxID=1697556 RepID=A0ABQ6PVE9_9BACT|nr:hypothetical protein Aconfl_42510 [Algoriphagus confluentis]